MLCIWRDCKGVLHNETERLTLWRRIVPFKNVMEETMSWKTTGQIFLLQPNVRLHIHRLVKEVCSYGVEDTEVFSLTMLFVSKKTGSNPKRNLGELLQK